MTGPGVPTVDQAPGTQPLRPSFLTLLAERQCTWCHTPMVKDNRCRHGDMHPDCCLDSRDDIDNYFLEYRDDLDERRG